MGASATFLIKRGTTSEENALSIAKLFCNGRQPDITIECSGAESSICTGILVTRSGGCLVLGRDHLSFFRSIGVPDIVTGLQNSVQKRFPNQLFRDGTCNCVTSLVWMPFEESRVVFGTKLARSQQQMTFPLHQLKPNSKTQ